MNDQIIRDIPVLYQSLLDKGQEIGFNMPSDLYVGSLLKTLMKSKPGAKCLELGTGIGLSLSWMMDGLTPNGHLTTIDNDPELIEIAQSYFGSQKQVEIICADGASWIEANLNQRYDLIFADAWPGKYGQLDEVLNMLNQGGYYVIDDMSQQPNWPEGHDKLAATLVEKLEDRDDLVLTKMEWSTGVMVCVKV